MNNGIFIYGNAYVKDTSDVDTYIGIRIMYLYTLCRSIPKIVYKMS